MRLLTCAMAALLLAGCASTTTVAPAKQTASSPPPVMDPAAPGPSANAAFSWCLEGAARETPSPAWTVRGGAFVRGFVQSCMVELGADPAYTLVLLQRI